MDELNFNDENVIFRGREALSSRGLPREKHYSYKPLKLRDIEKWLEEQTLRAQLNEVYE